MGGVQVQICGLAWGFDALQSAMCSPDRRIAVDHEECFERITLLALILFQAAVIILTLLQTVVSDAPQDLIGDNAYDSDRLDAELRFYCI